MTSAALNDPTTTLWATLRDFIAQAFSLFGAPHEIAQRACALRKDHNLLLMYLRQCEALLRRLLFLDALALAPSLVSGPLASSRQRSIRTRRFHEQDPENSETWRVTFRICAGAPFDGRLRVAKAAQGSAALQRSSETRSLPEPREARVETTRSTRFVSTWPAAERLEALIRAFNDPAPYVKRLARLIRRKPALTRLLSQTPERHYGRVILEEPIRDASLLIRQRRKEPDSS